MNKFDSYVYFYICNVGQWGKKNLNRVGSVAGESQSLETMDLGLTCTTTLQKLDPVPVLGSIPILPSG